MKHVDEYRDGALARALAARITGSIRPGRDYRFMEFCGGHTHAISRYGLEDLLPPSIRMIHGPGCPGAALAALRSHPLGRDAAIVGVVTEDEYRFVQMRTAFDGNRVIDWIAGEQLPRIC